MYIVPLTGLQNIESVKSIAAPSEPVKSSASLPFGDMLREAMESFSEAQKASELDAYSLVTGDISDLHTLTINSAIQQASLEMTVQLASRAVSAYKEVLQMSI
ncbi:MAG: flagellar hook-basal body complex protein FliE [Subdoligranulum sp.]|nr:flagellar hook-basal body complex protein FliE [Subdoligranulum sp.]MBD5103098.1 flagellar hook-basal body complex protein FliE [Subdoligranulum sp.]